MCYPSYCSWGQTQGLNDQLAVGPWYAMKRYVEVSMLTMKGGFQHVQNEIRYFKYLVQVCHIAVQPLEIAYFIEHSEDERPPELGQR